MSITDQIERIQGEVTSQTDLIEQIKTALAGKGGSDIQTCEVWFCKTSTATGAGIFGYGVTQLIDGVITSNTVMESARTQWIVPNVVCGSVVAMCSSVPSGNVILLNGSQDGATYMSSDTLGYSLIKLPNTPGTHVIELTAL